MTRRRWFLVLGLIAIAIAAVVAFVVLTPATRFTYGVTPLTRDEAVLLTRRNEDDATFFWVELVGSDGHVAWTRELTPVEIQDALGFSGVAATDDRVLLLGKRDETTVVVALSRATGGELWEAKVADIAPSRIGPMLIADPPRLYVIHDAPLGDAHEETITALALADGSLLWRLPPMIDQLGRAAMTRDVALRGPHRLLSTSPGGVVELDGATGAIRRQLPINRLRCGTPQDIVGSDGRKLTLLSRVPETGDDAPGRSVDLDANWRDAIDGPCGLRGGDLVVGVMHTNGGVGLTRIDPASGAARWLLELGPWLFDEGTTADGRLPRFLPIAVFGTQVEGGLMENQVVVVDLDEGTVVARHPVRDHMRPVVTAERAFVMGLFIHTVFALDPTTGALANATRLDGIDTADFRSEDFRFGTLWLTGMGWGGPADLSWAAIDLATGRPRRLNGKVVASDVTADGWSARR